MEETKMNLKSASNTRNFTYIIHYLQILFFSMTICISIFTAHPNIKLFITQCGLQSVQEAVYHGVPILGIPLFVDQKYNAQKIATAEIGLQLPFQELTKDRLLTSITAILNDSK